MSCLNRELVLLILQFLEEENFTEAAHSLEQESGFFFNMRYFEEKVNAGEWDDVEKYLSGFMKVDDNKYSTKIFFELRKQKYLEALDRQDKHKAFDILVKDLKVFSTFNGDLFREITQLLTLENFRENEQLHKYGDTKEARGIMLIELKKLIEANPLFHDKLVFPSLKSSRLRMLINQSLNWQHQLCPNPRPNPDIKTLFTDHSCGLSNGAPATSPVNISAAAGANPTAYIPLGIHAPFPVAASAANPNALADWLANVGAASSVQPAVVSASNLTIFPNQVSGLKHPITPPATLGMFEYQSADHEHLMKRLRTAQSVEKVTYPAVRQQSSWSLDVLPRKVAFTMQQRSSTVTSMDFHPFLHTLLLVGYSNGEVALWEVKTREKLLSKSFKMWDVAACSAAFQASGGKDAPISVSRVTWSPDGNYLGAAFTKKLTHLYAYAGANNLSQHLEIDAHNGGVNDLAFTRLNKQLCVVTCGDDKLIKLWDMSGRKLFNFEGHDAPVYSICPHQKDNIQFIFSTATDGKIKAWLFDNKGSTVDYDAPGQWCTTMLYSADGNRLFSCGTSKDGDSFLVEWNESEGVIKRSYCGFRKKSAGVVRFDTTQNHYLAAGEDNQIKFWHVDSTIILTATDADGDLPDLPYVRFNKEGNLLAVTTKDNGIKILANAAGLRSLRSVEGPSVEALRSPLGSAANKVSGSSSIPDVNRVNSKMERSLPVRPSATLNGVDVVSRKKEIPKPVDDLIDKNNPWQLTEIVDPIQCQLVTMDASEAGNKVSGLLYTNSGTGILVLGSRGLQKLWKWEPDVQNPSGKATAKVVPQQWQPSTGLLMTNDVAGVNLEEAFPCIALSKNDAYVMSACGGKVSLFNMMTSMVLTTFMSPPIVPTFLAFHPQDNNIVAVGMDDSTIYIYNVRLDEVKFKLKGHHKQVTGLAFSTALYILISSGADAHICVWSFENWEKIKSFPLQLPAGKSLTGDARVQFHSDEFRFLVSHETQLALYDARNMNRIQQWIPQDVLSAPISYATFSCNSQLVYASFYDGNLGIFDADSLRLRCRVSPSVYISQAVKGSEAVYPLVVAAHPQDPQQFAIGLTDGSVKVIEPLESEGKWGVSQPADNGFANGRSSASTSTNNHAAEQVQR